jgi:hypothetical protein
MNGRMKFGFIIAFVVLLMFFAFLSLVFLSPFASGGISGMNSVFVAVRTVIVLVTFFIIAMTPAMIKSAVTWGQWLGDFKKQKGRSWRGGHNLQGEEQGRTALEILDQRYARGETTRECTLE